jgi:serine/threonine protein kinase
MWAVGCIFGEMVLAEPLFQGKDELDQLSQICKIVGRIDRDAWPDVDALPLARTDRVRSVIFNPKYRTNTLTQRLNWRISRLGVELLGRMLTWDPAQRITARYARRRRRRRRHRRRRLTRAAAKRCSIRTGVRIHCRRIAR